MKAIKKLSIMAVTIISMFVVVFAGCGGGGGGGAASSSSSGSSTTISGIAAAGAPVIGYAYLKDSAGHTRGPVAIGTDGSFSFDVNGLTPPYYLRAEGYAGTTSYELHSAATSTTGTANINPLTNAVVAAAAGGVNPASVYGNPATYPITTANLNTAIADMRTLLQQLLAAFNADVNPVTAPFTANHTNLDAVFDVVKITVDPTQGGVPVVVTNKSTQVIIVQAGTNNLSNPTVPLDPNNIPSNTPVVNIVAIQNRLNSLASVMNSRGANITMADVESYVTSTANYGINDGFARQQAIEKQILTAPTTRGLQITGFTGLTIEGTTNGDYTVSGIAYFSDGSSGFPASGFVFTNDNGTWKLKGNGYKSQAGVTAKTGRVIQANGTTVTETGLHFELRDDGNQGIGAAVATGPGLPQGGVTLTKSQYDSVLLLDQAFQNGQLSASNLYLVSDNANIPDNSEYTITFYNNVNHTILTETRKVRVPKRPYKNSEITNGHFPVLSVSSHALSTVNVGGTFTFTYVLPTAYQTTYLEGDLAVWNNNNSLNVEKRLALNATSASFTTAAPAWTPTGAGLSIYPTDQFKRGIWYQWYFQ